MTINTQGIWKGECSRIGKNIVKTKGKPKT